VNFLTVVFRDGLRRRRGSGPVLTVSACVTVKFTPAKLGMRFQHDGQADAVGTSGYRRGSREHGSPTAGLDRIHF